MANTAEEKELQQKKEEKENLENQVTEAGTQAEQEAKKQGLSQEEVNAQIERARTEEKNKLYPQIEALTNSIKEIQEQLKEEKEEKEQIKKEAEQRAEQERLAKLSDQEKLTESITKLEEQLRESNANQERLEREAKERQKREELRRYKEAAIQAAGDEIISDLVTGNTVEEIDRSIEIAKARYAELADRFKAERGNEVRKNMPSSTSPDTEALDEEELERSIDNLDIDYDRYRKDKQYRKEIDTKRDRLQAQLAGAYARAAGR